MPGPHALTACRVHGMPRSRHGRYEWRRVTALEKAALWGVWREVGVALGISELPKDVVEFEMWGEDYERRTFRFCAAARRWFRATRSRATAEQRLPRVNSHAFVRLIG